MAVADKRRFSTIDNQLNRVSEIVGDGRIDGWEIVPHVFPDVIVTLGSGLIDKFYVNTFGDEVVELSESGIFYIYMQRKVGITGTTGPKSNVVSVGYTDDGPPFEVANFEAEIVGESSTFYFFDVVLTWNANTQPDFSHYEIEVSENGSLFQVVDNNVTSTIYTDSVEEDATYTYRIYAVDYSDNRSPYASATVNVPLSTALPQNPVSFLTPQSEAAINILWKRPPAVMFSTIQNWRLTYVELNSDGSEKADTSQTRAVNRLIYNDRIDDLKIGQPYRVTLQTVDVKGRLSTGVSSTVTPQPSPAPRDPQGVAYSITESGSGVEVSLSWTDGDTPYDPAISYRYKIYTTIDGQAESRGLDVPIGFTEEQVSLFTFDFLEYFPIPEDTLVTFRITALDEAGFESFGTYIRLVTSIFSLPKRLANVDATFDPDTQTIRVTWDNQSDTNDVRVVIDDDDLVDEYGYPFPLVDTRVGKSEIYVITNVELNHKYVIHLTPYNKDEVAGPTSTVIEFTAIPSNLPLPEAPTAIDIQSNDRQNLITWNTSESLFTKEYAIYRTVGDISFDFDQWELLDVMPKTILRFYDYGINNDTLYSYYITARDVYGRESLHLADGALNLNFIQGIPRREGILTEPSDVEIVLVGGNITVTWDALAEEFDGFTIYRSINNLHSWESIATLDKTTFLYTDVQLPLVDGTVFYYAIDKTVNDGQIVALTTSTAPENSLFLAKVTTSSFDSSEYSIDVTDRRDIKDMIDPLAEYTNRFILPHRHRGVLANDPARIDLNPQLIVTDWSTVDGRIFTTTEDDINGSSFVLKVDGRFPEVFYTIDPVNRQIIFAETIAEFDETNGTVIGEIPEIELRVLGIEEVQNVLDEFRFNNLHARQVQFGILNKEQLPEINHEGRIKEQLFPDRFLLERYNNHTFIVPQTNTDSTKNFGDGTTFYAITESDGKVTRVIDWDLQKDDAMVGFRKPSYSPTTVLNLKQHPVSGALSSSDDNANYYRFNQNGDFLTPSNAGQRGSIYFLQFGPQRNTLIGSIGSATISSFAADTVNRKFYGLQSGDLIEIDPASGEQLNSVSFSGSTSTINVIAFAGSTLYGVNNSNNNLYSVNSETGITSLLGSIGSSITGMAYVTSESTMYAIVDGTPDELNTISLTDGSLTSIGNLSSNVSTSLWYRESSGPGSFVGDTLFYGTTLGEIYRIDDRVTPSDTNIATWDYIPSTGYTFNEFWWRPEASALRMGDYDGLKSDTFLRFPVNIPSGTTVGEADLVFTADDSNPGNGNNVVFSISIVDPSEYSDSTDLDFSFASLNTIGSIIWSPLTWSSGERSDNTTVSISYLVQQFIDDENYFAGKHMIVKVKTLDVSSTGHYRNSESFAETNPPTLEMSYVVDTAKVTSDPGGFQSEKSYQLEFEFEDDDPTRWVRVSTFETDISPNPVIDLTKRVRFRYYLESGSLYLTLGIREITGSNREIGSNGGSAGPIEWVGAESTVSDDFGNVAPIGIRLDTVGEWTEVDIDLRKAAIQPFVEGNGNGILNKTGFGVIEHFAFTVDPESDSPTGPFVIRIDELEQVSDLLVAGTSQGILLSQDFGTTWELSRLTDTPVHKFYRASNNSFLWAISATEVLLAVDPAFWFATQGTTGLEYIRDITEDINGNMFISSDKGVYWLEIDLIRSFSTFRQTQPINAFTTDTYALHHNPVSSGIDEIWVSTEIGIYKTSDFGITWQDTGLSTAGLVAFQIINIGSTAQPNLIAVTRKHILRKMYNESQFQIIANFEEQHNIFDIWKSVYFNGLLYVSTGDGIYVNNEAILFVPGISNVPFVKVLDGLDFNGFTQVAFGLDVVNIGDLGSRLMVGLENRLAQVSEAQKISFKTTFDNKELPSFFIDDVETTIGYIYNAFNKSVSFREGVLVNRVVSSANIPRRSFFAKNGGWAQTNPGTDVFIYKNGIPTWLDFDYNTNSILGELQLLDGKLREAETLSTFNSLLPTSQDLLDALLIDIANIRSGGEDGVPLINNESIIQFLDDYTRFLSVVTEAYANRNELAPIPITRTGISRSSRQAGSRASTLEAKENFESEESTAIDIDITTGEVDFTTAFANATDPVERQKFRFDKFDHMSITIFNANVSGTGEFAHKELEDKMEDVNTGLTSDLARSAYTNLIKSGIFIENQHNYLFDRYNASNIQSKFYAAYTNSWYDILNSTLDYQIITSVPNLPEMRFPNVVALFDEDPYFSQKIWVGTDDDISQFGFNSDNELELQRFIRPGDVSMFIWDIWSPNGSDIYVVAAEQESGKGHIYFTSNYGASWTEEETINLPNQIYRFRIINGTRVVTTNEGVFYNDNSFGTYFKSDAVPSDNLIDSTLSLAAFTQSTFNMIKSTFLIVESDRWFYTSGSGLEFFAIAGQLSFNNVTVINTILRHKNLTWIGTDKGLYNDGNSLLSDSVQWGLQTTLEDSLQSSTNVTINDMVAGVDALYAGSGSGKIYRYFDEGDGSGNQWTKYQVSNFGPIHRMILLEDIDRLVIFSYNKVRALDISTDNGVFS